MRSAARPWLVLIAGLVLSGAIRYEKTGKFDYELCYLLRKQEAQEDLKQWIGKVIQKRRVGDDDFGKEVDPMRFNDLAESVKQRAAGKPLFRDALLRSLANDIEN